VPRTTDPEIPAYMKPISRRQVACRLWVSLSDVHGTSAKCQSSTLRAERHLREMLSAFLFAYVLRVSSCLDVERLNELHRVVAKPAGAIEGVGSFIAH